MELKLLKVNHCDNVAYFKYNNKLLCIKFDYDREFLYLPLAVQLECAFKHYELKDYSKYLELKTLQPAQSEIIKLIEGALYDKKISDKAI